ncbi:hypothetical protein ELI43_06640 [Rhizobium leguminosarum]|uniref:hypothetical protein n=1 Tax=Rhizobium leguminosarum TaxID=384 RepID=UPI001031F81E|nr:hypothetical protein [Rhizobium leguminosarum]TAU52517.1 hypothetical protein ELI43_06640 [Rhizobium leguminosarum]
MTTRYLWTLEREGRSTRSGLDTVDLLTCSAVGTQKEHRRGGHPKPAAGGRRLQFDEQVDGSADKSGSHVGEQQDGLQMPRGLEGKR